MARSNGTIHRGVILLVRQVHGCFKCCSTQAASLEEVSVHGAHTKFEVPVGDWSELCTAGRGHLRGVFVRLPEFLFHLISYMLSERLEHWHMCVAYVVKVGIQLRRTSDSRS
jgi:hypothetical protein